MSWRNVATKSPSQAHVKPKARRLLLDDLYFLTSPLTLFGGCGIGKSSKFLLTQTNNKWPPGVGPGGHKTEHYKYPIMDFNSTTTIIGPHSLELSKPYICYLYLHKPHSS